MKKRLLFFLFVGLWAVIVNGHNDSLPALDKLADRLQRFGERIPQEKVFVHMDNTCYYLGDTIWFAAYTRQTNTDRPSKISRVLYVELWNHDGYLVERKLLEMKDGRGNGFFALPDTLYSGYFELRAYTRWQLNWGQTEHEHPWVKEDYNDTVNAEFYRDYEKLHSRVFPVYDKPKEQGTYYKDMTFRPLRRYFKNAPPPPELRLSLFPEGGNLVAGVPCRVAFEAATSEGEVREGTVSLLMKNEEISMKNEQGEEVTSVRTENRGRGTFTFTPVEGQSYDVVFHADGDSTKRGRVTEKIKAVTGDGVSLRLRHTGDEWTANIQAVGSAAQHPLGMTVMHEGRLQCFTALTPDARQVVLADSTLSAGINQLTVFDAEGRVYADRLFFVTKPELQHTTLMMDGMKEEYKPFEQVSLQVTAPSLIGKAGGESSHLSLSVRDAVHQDNIFDSGNILTEMLLSSEIKGFVPQPEYFFEADDAEHRRALDLLMLTQGWRRFGWKEMAVEGVFELTHPAEYTQMVTGSVHPYRVENEIDTPILQGGVLEGDELNPDHPNAKAIKRSEKRNDALGKGWGSDYQSRVKKTKEFMDSTNLMDEYQREEVARRKDNAIKNAIELSAPQLPEGFDPEMRDFLRRDWRRFIAMYNLKREVRVHAEFVRGEDIIVGEQETKNKGSFNIDLPHFYGECHFFLDASDTTLWPRKKDGVTLRKKHKWIREQDSENEKLPELPEFYVRLHWPYPRYVKPYTFYQTHHASLRDTTTLSPKLLTDGTHLMREVNILAPENGQLHLDFSKPAYVMDAYEATNMAMDAGQLDRFVSWEYMQDESKWIADAVAHTLVADMGTSRVPDFTLFYDTLKVFGHYPYKNYQYVNQEWIASGERLRWGRLEYLDKIYLYTDYSPRREGDARYEQDNQPSLDVRLVRFPANVSRMTYLNRYYILKGFAYQEDFYHPDYHRNPPKEGQKDYRRTLYWNPDLQLDEEGRANITFFNNSQTTRLCVEANGQAADGTLLYNKK